jgi:CDP-glucose 4,6-dehydratase
VVQEFADRSALGFWKRKKVFITGHTGFKGSWLSLWLNELGAEVTGYALNPPTSPSLFVLSRLGTLLRSNIADIRDSDSLSRALDQSRAEVVFHLAAQSLVRESYRNPVETYQTNVMGTVNLLEAIRSVESVRAVVVVSSDKCYENQEGARGYRETDPLGGYDPYSSSKACTELITSAYRNSFFPPSGYERHGVAVASARAGNVVGGGDWGEDRLLPDCFRAFQDKRPVRLRNPGAIRPWQFVLEPLHGYLQLASQLWHGRLEFAESWNFGPDEQDFKTVEWVTRKVCQLWGEGARYEIDASRQPHETGYLRLNCSKARSRLGWLPCWGLERALESTVEWFLAHGRSEPALDVCRRQIAAFQQTCPAGEPTRRKAHGESP